MLCACRSGPLWLRLIVLVLAMLLAFAGWTRGDPDWVKPLPREEPRGVPGKIVVEGTRAMDQRVLTRGAVLVAFGTEMDLAEAQVLLDSLLSLDCAGLEEPVREEVSALRGALRLELARHLGSEADRVMAAMTEARLAEALARAAREEAPCVLRHDEFAIEIGFRTYRYWAVHFDPSRGSEMTKVLPPTRQAYLRFVIRDFPRMGT